MGLHPSDDSFDYIKPFRDLEEAGVLGPLFGRADQTNDLDVGRDILEVKAILPGLLFMVISAVELCSPGPWVLHFPFPWECHQVRIRLLCIRW